MALFKFDEDNKLGKHYAWNILTNQSLIYFYQIQIIYDTIVDLIRLFDIKWGGEGVFG